MLCPRQRRSNRNKTKYTAMILRFIVSSCLVLPLARAFGVVLPHHNRPATTTNTIASSPIQLGSDFTSTLLPSLVAASKTIPGRNHNHQSALESSRKNNNNDTGSGNGGMFETAAGAVLGGLLLGPFGTYVQCCCSMAFVCASRMPSIQFMVARQD